MDKQTEYAARAKYDFPTYTGFPQYDGNSKRGALLYPLFPAISVYPQWHINCALWSANSWLIHSNMRVNGIPVLFYIDNTIFEKAREQLQYAGVPDKWIIPYEPPKRPHNWNGMWLAQSLWCATDERLTEYDNIVYPDSDCFLMHPGSGVVDIEQFFQRTDRTQWATLVNKQFGNPEAIRPFTYYELPETESVALFKDLVKNNLGFEVENVHNVLAILNHFDPNHIDNEFKDFVRNNVPFFGSEEMTLSLYMDYSSKDLENYPPIDIQRVLYLKDFYEYLEDRQPAIGHVRPQKLKPIDDKQFQRQRYSNNWELNRELTPEKSKRLFNHYFKSIGVPSNAT